MQNTQNTQEQLDTIRQEIIGVLSRLGDIQNLRSVWESVQSMWAEEKIAKLYRINEKHEYKEYEDEKIYYENNDGSEYKYINVVWRAEDLSGDVGGSVQYNVYNGYSEKYSTLKDSGKYTIRFDGSSRGNPGDSTGGICVFDERGLVVYRKGFKVRGIATSNQAEYTALIYTLDFILSRGLKGVLVQGDSLLVINQLNGVFQCRSENLIRYYNTAKKLILKIQTQLGTTPVFEYIPRERNDEADRECQEAHKVGYIYDVVFM